MISAIVLAGGDSARFGEDKALADIEGKPMIRHIIDRIRNCADEFVIAAGTTAQRDKLAEIVPEAVFAVDRVQGKGPLLGLASALDVANGELAAVLTCDVPLVSPKVIGFMLDLCLRPDAVVPRWPNGYVEPLQGAYKVRRAQLAAARVIEAERFDMRSLLSELHVLYLSTLVIKSIDSKLRSLFNVNTLEDLRAAERLLRSERPL
jgi:molybdopterin-guanine dinucleotide biosynthesis protein A